MEKTSKLKFKPLNESTWTDFEELFGERGACGGRWCMYWRLRSSEFKKMKGNENKNLMKSLAHSGEITGVIAYESDKAVGWCAVAPRDKYIRLENSRVLKRIDNKPVWSISCFFVAKEYRRKGISVELLKGAAEYANKNGAGIVEGYPIVPYNKNIPAAFAWTGIPSAFEKAGFTVAERRSKTRPIMRLYF